MSWTNCHQVTWFGIVLWLAVTTNKRLEIAEPRLSKFQQLSVGKLLTQSVFARLHVELLRDQPTACAWDLVNEMCVVLVSWLFPPHLKSRRCNSGVGLLLCLFLIAGGTIWLKRHYMTKIGQQVMRTLPGDLTNLIEHMWTHQISSASLGGLGASCAPESTSG